MLREAHHTRAMPLCVGMGGQLRHGGDGGFIGGEVFGEAVSYTHLDVYKRQPLWSPEAKPLAGQGQRPWVPPINTRA